MLLPDSRAEAEANARWIMGMEREIGAGARDRASGSDGSAIWEALIGVNAVDGC